jgi:hypothetical protein
MHCNTCLHHVMSVTRCLDTVQVARNKQAVADAVASRSDQISRQLAREEEQYRRDVAAQEVHCVCTLWRVPGLMWQLI